MLIDFKCLICVISVRSFVYTLCVCFHSLSLSLLFAMFISVVGMCVAFDGFWCIYGQRERAQISSAAFYSSSIRNRCQIVVVAVVIVYANCIIKHFSLSFHSTTVLCCCFSSSNISPSIVCSTFFSTEYVEKTSLLCSVSSSLWLNQ